MVEQKNQGLNPGVGSKKRHLPSEMAHRFQCKDDFLNYFSQQRKYALLKLTLCTV